VVNSVAGAPTQCAAEATGRRAMAWSAAAARLQGGGRNATSGGSVCTAASSMQRSVCVCYAQIQAAAGMPRRVAPRAL